MGNVDRRLKIIHFFRKYKKVILLIVIVWFMIITFNFYLRNIKFTQAPTTTYTPNTAVLKSSSKVPDKVSKSFDDFVNEYIEACNTGNYKEAYNSISEDCKKNFFNNDYDEFVRYVRNKFDEKKSYAIQNYSNYNDKYIYSVKIFEDFLATGLTNSNYQYQEEFMVASYNEDNEVVFSVGNYIESRELSAYNSNDYLKVDLKNVMIKYSYEVYEIDLTNRTDYTIVIQAGNAEINEICLVGDDEYRGTTNYDLEIVLQPNESRTVQLAFPKFYDSNSTSNKIVLNAVRIMEQYTGIKENVESELENAIDKFSMSIEVK